MNRLLKYTWIIVLFAAMSCAISKKENERIDQMIGTEQVAGKVDLTDSLTQGAVISFEERAIQKLEDFYDYLNLISDGRYHDALKSEIRNSAIELFYDEKVSIRPFREESGGTQLVKCLDEQLDKTEASNLAIHSVEVKQHLTKESGNVYLGQLSFVLQDVDFSDSLSAPKMADFSLRRIKNDVGAGPNMMWEVYLERIY